MRKKRRATVPRHAPPVPKHAADQTTLLRILPFVTGDGEVEEMRGRFPLTYLDVAAVEGAMRGQFPPPT